MRNTFDYGNGGDGPAEPPGAAPGPEARHQADPPGADPGAAVPLQLTRFTAIQPTRLSKRFTLVGDVLFKESGGNMLEGIAERLTVGGVAGFAALLAPLNPRQALAYGINGPEQARVTVKEAVKRAGGELPVIARTRDFFQWASGAGILMLDYDPAPAGPGLSRDELQAALVLACPALAAAPMVWRPSAGSCVYAGGVELRGITGQRFYILVTNAADIPRAGQALFDRLWLAGFGRYG